MGEGSQRKREREEEQVRGFEEVPVQDQDKLNLTIGAMSHQIATGLHPSDTVGLYKCV